LRRTNRCQHKEGLHQQGLTAFGSPKVIPLDAGGAGAPAEQLLSFMLPHAPCGNIQKITGEKKGWGGTFGITDGWKCNFCLLPNNEKDNNCSACEVARGTKYQHPELSAPPQDAVGAVFAGSTSIGISALTWGGFQFGAPAPLASAASPPASAGPTGLVLTSGGFQFGARSAMGGLSPSGLPNTAGMAVGTGRCLFGNFALPGTWSAKSKKK
jgi:hypothetical protein